jgi:hypothetical protein
LTAKGLVGRGAGAPVKIDSIDSKYDKLEKAGKLRSAAFTVPWTASEAQKLAKERAAEEKKERMALAAKNKKSGAPTPKKTAKTFGGWGAKKATPPAPAPAPEPKKAGGFGSLFGAKKATPPPPPAPEPKKAGGFASLFGAKEATPPPPPPAPELKKKKGPFGF